MADPGVEESLGVEITWGSADHAVEDGEVGGGWAGNPRATTPKVGRARARTVSSAARSL